MLARSLSLLPLSNSVMSPNFTAKDTVNVALLGKKKLGKGVPCGTLTLVNCGLLYPSMRYCGFYVSVNKMIYAT